MGCVWGIPSLSPLSSLVNMYEHTYIHYLDPEIKAGGGEAVSKNNFFRVFGPQFGLKIRGGAGPPGPLPGIRHCVRSQSVCGRLWFLKRVCMKS